MRYITGMDKQTIIEAVYVVTVLALYAVIGVMLAWRG